MNVPKKTWEILLTFFRAEEKILRYSYGIPGKMKEWLDEYRRKNPEGAKRYERLRDAIKSVKRRTSK